MNKLVMIADWVFDQFVYPLFAGSIERRVESKRKNIYVSGTIGQFPHCDQKILHAPGECEFCDRQPVWQRLREAWGIAYTGHPVSKGDGTVARPHGVHQRWPGNTPKGYQG